MSASIFLAPGIESTRIVFDMDRMHFNSRASGVSFAVGILACLILNRGFTQEPRYSQGLELVSAVSGPNAGLRPGSLYFVRASVLNRGAKEETATLVCKFTAFPSDETAYEIRLEAGESRTYELPLLVPRDVARNLDIQVNILGIRDGREVVLEKQGLPMSETITAFKPEETIVAAMAVEPIPESQAYWNWPIDDLHESAEMVISAKVGAGFNRQMLRVEDDGLPSSLSWDVVDCFVVADALFLKNAANQNMLKRWLLDGGRLWVMLDRVPSELLTPLLETDQFLSTVDETEMMNFEVQAVTSVTTSVKDRTIESPVPLKLKRIVQTGGSVTHHVGEWPVAVWFPVGKGEILATTLSPRAWLRPRYILPDTPNDKKTAYELKLWAFELSTRFFQSRPENHRTSSLNESDYPLRQVGNPVVSKSIVNWSLGLFVAALAAVGTYQLRYGGAYRLGWMVPAVAVLGCVPLVLASQWIRSEIPETWGRLQLVDVAADGSNALVRELSSLYLNDSNSMSLQSSIESRIEPMSKQSVGVRRWIWNDLDQWTWRNNNWPSGLWRANSMHSVPLDNLVVKGTLDEKGLVLKTPAGLKTPLQDPMVSFSRGSQLLCSSISENTWFAGSSQIAGGERWISGTLISDEQMRRAEIYRTLFEKKSGLEARGKRILYGFTDVWEGGPTWDRDLVRRGSALVSLPIHLERPIPGRPIQVPYSLMTVEALHQDGIRTNSFNEKSGRWKQDATTGSVARVRFHLPPELKPFQVTSISIEALANAPQRKFILSRMDQGKPSEIVSIENPSIPWGKTLTDPTIMPDPNQGYIDLQVEVTARLGANAEFEQVVNWGIEYIRLHVNGIVLSNAIDP